MASRQPRDSRNAMRKNPARPVRGELTHQKLPSFLLPSGTRTFSAPLREKPEHPPPRSFSESDFPTLQASVQLSRSSSQASSASLDSNSIGLRQRPTSPPLRRHSILKTPSDLTEAEVFEPTPDVPWALEGPATLRLFGDPLPNDERRDSGTVIPLIVTHPCSPQKSHATLDDPPAPLRRDDMAAGINRMSGDARRFPSPGTFNNRYENQRPMNTLCRNGPQCRKFQEGTCSYNHDFGGGVFQTNGLSTLVPPLTSGYLYILSNCSSKKSLNVDSPSFTPNYTPKPANALPAKSLGLSPKAAAAASFTPRGSGMCCPTCS
jgi:hypothetical protein